ncbi:DNA repair RAD51 [Babesia ovata]|uniref:DNA repair RAD51 n=1 Tax=Babesia ovata TaxID=189622 RepID=A0A2H6KBZ7_9APIC|nr:DNA repair RAD51 [Babesia ovata]GBE60512.1 DNA repair RAD51 [Babesia ovata]
MDRGRKPDFAKELKANTNTFNKSSLLRSYADLAFVCGCVYDVHPSAAVFEPAASSVRVRPSFRSALECLLDRASEDSGVCADASLRCIFDNLLRGAGIAEVTGASGSGKTSFCLSYANTSPGITLYVDTSGSVCLSRVVNRDKFILLRVFSCEELELVVSDFANRLSEDGYLPCFGDIRARSVAVLVIDSLWPVGLLDSYLRRRFLFRLCVTLRHISWQHNLAVLVCNHEARWDGWPSSAGKRGNRSWLREAFRSRCYVHVSLEQHACFGDNSDVHGLAYTSDSSSGHTAAGNSGANQNSDGSLGSGFAVRRVMFICSGDTTMPSSVAGEIPWRRGDVEVLHQFLLSARDRSRLMSGGDKGSAPSLQHNYSVENDDSAEFGHPSHRFAGVVSGVVSDSQSSASSGYRRDGTHNPLRNFYSAPKRSRKRASPSSDDAGDRLNSRAANICILRGQTGSGKVSAVRRLCSEIGLKVIEYDPFENDVVYMAEGQAQDAFSATFLRFLDTVRRKPGLRISRDAAPSKAPVVESDASSRRLKRIRMLFGGLKSLGDADTLPSKSQEAHLILLKDLPRTVLSSSNPGFNRRVQEITRSILDGDGFREGLSMYPLLICVDNSTSDRRLLRSILPYNYESHPRCMRLNVAQITKAKTKTLLFRFLSTLGRPCSVLNEQLVDYLSRACCGDLRFGMCNLHFFSSVDRHSASSVKSEMDTLLQHMCERNSTGAVFNVLGKVLVNKRVRAILRSDTDSSDSGGPSISQSSSDLTAERFRKCFELSSAVYCSNFGNVGDNSGITEDYSDVLEILSTISDDLMLMPSRILEVEPPSQESDIDEALCRAVVCGYNMVQPGGFDASLLGALPASVRMFGLVEPFNPSLPLSMCRWPTVVGDASEEPSRQPRSVQLPLLTRPQLYYNPDELVESGNVDSSFLVDSVFENYAHYFEDINDCAVLTTQLCDADVTITGYRHAGGMTDDAWDQVQSTFACFCARAVCCCNLGGSGRPANFRMFTKGVWQSESINDMNHLKALYDGHLRDLIARSDGGYPSWHLSSAYISKSRAFVEIVPFMYMLLSQSGASSPSRTLIPDAPLLDWSLGSSNIMTDSMLERIDMLMSEDTHATPRNNGNATAGFGTVVTSRGILETVTPKFKELVTEIGKHYEGTSGRQCPSGSPRPCCTTLLLLARVYLRGRIRLADLFHLLLELFPDSRR